ncbi:serine protein kinase RIO [soil metagenome]
MSDYDEFGDEKFTQRKGKRKPKVTRRVKELVGKGDGTKGDGTKGDGAKVKFDDPDLQTLFERGVLSELLWQMQSGKDATVYAAEGPKGKLAAKIYADPRARTFRRDEIYREGRFVSRGRFKKAMQQAGRTGLPAEHILWVEDEFRALQTLHRAGILVPRPVAHAGSVILMGYIGDEHPAPRLADAQLSAAEAADAFEQSLSHLAAMLRLGLVHGDYSTFNLLWWQGSVVVIDLPQMVKLKESKHAGELLERDVQSLLKSFRSFGIEAELLEVLREVKARAKGTPEA